MARDRDRGGGADEGDSSEEADQSNEQNTLHWHGSPPRDLQRGRYRDSEQDIGEVSPRNCRTRAERRLERPARSVHPSKGRGGGRERKEAPAEHACNAAQRVETTRRQRSRDEYPDQPARRDQAPDRDDPSHARGPALDERGSTEGEQAENSSRLRRPGTATRPCGRGNGDAPRVEPRDGGLRGGPQIDDSIQRGAAWRRGRAIRRVRQFGSASARGLGAVSRARPCSVGRGQAHDRGGRTRRASATTVPSVAVSRADSRPSAFHSRTSSR